MLITVAGVRLETNFNKRTKEIWLVYPNRFPESSEWVQ
jgi:hypothetical protein